MVRIFPMQYQLAAVLGMAQSNFSSFLDGIKGALAFRVAFLLECLVEDALGMPCLPALEGEQVRRYPTCILAARAAYVDGVPLSRIEQGAQFLAQIRRRCRR